MKMAVALQSEVQLTDLSISHFVQYRITERCSRAFALVKQLRAMPRALGNVTEQPSSGRRRRRRTIRINRWQWERRFHCKAGGNEAVCSFFEFRIVALGTVWLHTVLYCNVCSIHFSARPTTVGVNHSLLIDEHKLWPLDWTFYRLWLRR